MADVFRPRMPGEWDGDIVVRVARYRFVRLTISTNQNGRREVSLEHWTARDADEQGDERTEWTLAELARRGVTYLSPPAALVLASGLERAVRAIEAGHGAIREPNHRRVTRADEQSK